jgi:hypothetical protein
MNWYFADGQEKLIRVKTSAPMGSPEFYDADAEKFTARGGRRPSSHRLSRTRREPATEHLGVELRRRRQDEYGEDAR